MKRVAVLVLCVMVPGMLALRASAVGRASENAFETIYVFGNEYGFASLNNLDETLFVTAGKGTSLRAFWLRNGVIVKRIPDGALGMFSPDGRFYSYSQGSSLVVCDEKDSIIRKFKFCGSLVESVTWSGDSKSLVVCTVDDESRYLVSRYDVASGKTFVLLSTREYFHPVTISDSDTLFLLKKRDPDAPATDSDIVRYSLSTKVFSKVCLPPASYHIWDSFTISPDGRIAVFMGVIFDLWETSEALYVVDLTQGRLLDCIDLKNDSVSAFAWRADSSYVIFSLNLKKIVRYEIPKDKDKGSNE